MALVLLLDGAGGHAQDGLDILRSLADQAGLVLVAPAADAATWDIIAARTYGSDVSLIDQALTHVFERYAIDPEHVALGGFSDGASYALTLGLANGDLFTHVLAFSPGFIGPMTARGEPRIISRTAARTRSCPSIPAGAASSSSWGAWHLRSRTKNSTAGMSFRPKWRSPPSRGLPPHGAAISAIRRPWCHPCSPADGPLRAARPARRAAQRAGTGPGGPRCVAGSASPCQSRSAR